MVKFFFLCLFPSRKLIEEILGQIFCSRGRPLVILLDVLQFQGTSSRIYWTSSRNPTGRPLEFCKFASNDLELPISSRNAIKNFTGRPLENSRGRPVEFTGRPVKSTGRPLEFSRGRPLEQKIWPIVPPDLPSQEVAGEDGPDLAPQKFLSSQKFRHLMG